MRFSMSTVRLSVVALLTLAGIAGTARPATAQATGTIAGAVTDQAGQPVAGARIAIVGTTLVGLTKADGQYVISNVPAGAATVRIALIGYAAVSRSVTVVADETVRVDAALTQAPFTLDAIVTTATGEQAKRELGNSISRINAGDLVPNAPVANMGDLLVAKAPGVQVLPANLTGGESRVLIRGANSISLSNLPIYYIDGVRMESANGSTAIGVGGTDPSRVNDINPEEIESIEIVKGPSAATLYGTDAVNGVIVIKTKRGRAGPARWSVYNELGVIRDNNAYPTAYRAWRRGPTPGTTSSAGNTVQCLLTQVARGDCTQDSITTFNVFEDPETSPLGTGWRGQAGTQVTGGSDVLRYFFSAEYEEEIGVVRMPGFAYGLVQAARRITEVPYEQFRPNALEKVSLRANVQASLNPKLDVQVSTGYISSSLRLPQTDNNVTGFMANAVAGPGNRNNFRAPVPSFEIGNVPLFGYWTYTPSETFADLTSQGVNRLIGSGTITYRPTTWLGARFVTGIDFTNRVDEELCRQGECPAFAATIGNFKQGFKEEDRTNLYNYSVDGNVTATYSLSTLLRGQTTAGMQYFQRRLAQNIAFGFGLPPGATTVGAGALQQAQEATVETRTLGYFVEQQFTLRDRLYVTGALRADDNTAFGKDFDVVVYPKFSVSWVASEEPFFPVLGWLSSLRLRSAVGASGQQPGSTDAIPFFAPTTANINGTDTPALTLSAVGNLALKPERATEIELGLDATLFENRINLELTYYLKRARDALISRPLAPSLGGPASRFENLGSVRNAGVEVALNATILNRGGLGWDVSVAASHNSNKIEDLGGLPPIVGATIQQREGYPVDAYWQRPILGYHDLNGNGIVEGGEILVGDSAVFIGSSRPTTELTLSTGFDLFNRRLRISGLMDYKGGRYLLNGTQRIRCESFLNCDEVVDPNAPLWKQIRTVALREHPARTLVGFMEPADFARLREVAVTYALPDSWARALRMQRASVTLAGRNLFTITDYTGIDPEAGYLDGDAQVQNDFVAQAPSTYWTMRVNLAF
jgi:TonB-linked SusC/RagA family outer membrane protein